MEYTTPGENEYMQGIELLYTHIPFNLRQAMECFKSAANQGHEEPKRVRYRKLIVD